MSDPIVFALLVLALLAVPGPTNTLLAGSGAMRGVLRSLPLLLGELVGYNVSIATLRATLGTVFSQASGAQTLLTWAIAAYLVFLAVRLWRVSPTESASAFTIRRVFPHYATKPQRFDFRALHFSAAAISYRRPRCSFLDDGGGRWHTMDCRRFAGNPAHARPLHFRCAEDLRGGVSSVRYGRSLWFPALTGETSADFTRSSVRTMAVILLIFLALPGTRQAHCGGGPECFRCE